jgi:hypothetical protein
MMAVTVLLQLVVILACALLAVTAIQVIGELPPLAYPATFALWLSVALGAVSIAMIWRDMEPATALMLLLLSVLVWSHRHALASETHESGRRETR